VTVACAADWPAVHSALRTEVAGLASRVNGRRLMQRQTGFFMILSRHQLRTLRSVVVMGDSPKGKRFDSIHCSQLVVVNFD